MLGEKKTVKRAEMSSLEIKMRRTSWAGLWEKKPQLHKIRNSQWSMTILQGDTKS